MRLWIAATDYANEMSVSEEILKRMADSYRRMRNTLRFLLGNMHGFDPAEHAVAWHELVAIDQWAIAKAFALQNDVVTAYRNYEFHDIYQKIHNFCVVELGGFYLDIIKDRLYTTGAASNPRRSAQTAMYHIAAAMVRWLAPILSFTAEEAWSYLPGVRSDSVFLNTWHQFPPGAERETDIDWAALIALKSDVARDLERLRAAGRDRRALEAEVTVFAPAAQAARFAALGDELRFVLITSQAQVIETRHAAGRAACHRAQRGASGSRSSPARSPSACAAGICAATWAAIPPIRSFARAASSTSRARARSGASHERPEHVQPGPSGRRPRRGCYCRPSS